MGLGTVRFCSGAVECRRPDASVTDRLPLSASAVRRAICAAPLAVELSLTPDRRSPASGSGACTEAHRPGTGTIRARTGKLEHEACGGTEVVHEQGVRLAGLHRHGRRVHSTNTNPAHIYGFDSRSRSSAWAWSNASRRDSPLVTQFS